MGEHGLRVTTAARCISVSRAGSCNLITSPILPRIAFSSVIAAGAHCHAGPLLQRLVRTRAIDMRPSALRLPGSNSAPAAAAAAAQAMQWSASQTSHSDGGGSGGSRRGRKREQCRQELQHNRTRQGHISCRRHKRQVPEQLNQRLLGCRGTGAAGGATRIIL